MDDRAHLISVRTANQNKRYWVLISRATNVILIVIFSYLIITSAQAAQPCEQWSGKALSIQGEVEVSRADQTSWVPISNQELLCPGDSLRVDKRSRAAILLPNQTLLRLSEGSALTFVKEREEERSWLDLLNGAVHFISRTPRTVNIKTPYVNAGIEGTEFALKVDPDKTSIWVFEGQVSATNPQGKLLLASGEAAFAEKGSAPVRKLVVRPRDAVQWALYYPPVIDYREETYATGPAAPALREVLAQYKKGDLPAAFARLDAVPKDSRTAQYYNLRAGLLLSVGLVDDARADIDQANALDPNDGTAYALQSVIAVTQNDNEKALTLAQKGADLSPRSPVPQIALSYAHQAQFDIEKAKQSVEQAVDLAPQDALAWARLAEVWLMTGDTQAAQQVADQAVALDPNLSHTQSVLGFASLREVNLDTAIAAFIKAITLDSAAPLPRLGLGLVKIRRGDLTSGREEIETATLLDPNNALLRSYMGKAYYEEKRSPLASEQFAIAKDLDPNDPTSWFYDSIQLQAENRPVEALQAQQRAIQLNDNRGVYRSRQLLDQDEAARSVALGRIYSDLNFEQLSKLQATIALAQDPGNHSAHRLLADSYAGITNLDAARQSELLQAKLTQPLNLDPLQPQLSNANLGLLDGNGPGDLSYNEYNPLFTRNGMALQLDAAVAEQNTWSNDAIIAGLFDRFTFSLGQYHTETDGFRANADYGQDIYSAFAQFAFSENTSIQIEISEDKETKGDVSLRLLPEFIKSENIRLNNKTSSIRIGLNQALTNNINLLLSATQRDIDFSSISPIPGFNPIVNLDRDMDLYDAQLNGKHSNYFWLAGMSHNREVQDGLAELDFSPKPCPPLVSCLNPIIAKKNQTRLYGYIYYHPIRSLSLTGGITAIREKIDSDNADKKAYPKLGLQWQPTEVNEIRLAVFKNRSSVFPSSQYETLEPTQIAGFNQIQDDLDRTDSWNYSAAFNHSFSKNLISGINLLYRDLESTLEVRDLSSSPPDNSKQGLEYQDITAGLWVYWTATDHLGLGTDYYFNDYNLEKGLSSPGTRVFAPDNVLKLKTHILPISISYYHPSGISTQLTATYYNQDGRFVDSTGNIENGEDQGWITDLIFSYRFPKRLGSASIGVKNLFNTELLFEDRDSYDSANATRSATPSKFSEEQLLFCKLSFNFR